MAGSTFPSDSRPRETDSDLTPYLQPTWFVDSDSPPVVAYARQAIGDTQSDVDKACRLFYAVRDDIRYSAYGISFDRETFRASHVLESAAGWCVSKSCLLAAAARAVGMPCRLGYATVRNHLATKKLLAVMQTDIFYYHGYNELWIDGRWVKATVAFNRSLCEKARLAPLEFDGRHDSLYHPFDLEGRRHMEYLEDYGAFADVQYDAILAKFRQVYPTISATFGTPAQLDGDFEAEVEAESTSDDPPR